MDIDDLVETFEMLGEWEDRYRYIIELGRKLPAMPEADHTEDNKVRGCMSQVWMTARLKDGRLQLQGDSDAHIVKGLIALLFKLTDGRLPAEVLSTDIGAIFSRLGLEQHISMNRRNGFYAMVEKIKAFAAQSVTQAG